MKIMTLSFGLFLYFSTVCCNVPKDDQAFLGFVQGPANFGTFCTENGIKNVQITNAFAQFYGLSLGVLYRLKRDWHCENANEKAPEWFNKDKCEYFGKCLAVLYEYLANVHAGHEVTRPIFVNGSIKITFVAVLDRLAWMCNNFFNDLKLISEENAKIFYEMSVFVQISLENEVNYEKCAEYAEDATEFDKILNKMYKKAKDWVKLEKGREKGKSAANFYDIILDTPAYSLSNVENDGKFIDFIKNGTNSFNFKTMKDINFNVCLVLLYLMKSNWNCAKAKETNNANECEKLRNYLDIFYEYLLRVRFGLTAVKPMFQTLRKWEIRPFILDLGDLINEFDRLSEFHFGPGNDKASPNNLKLTNENELNYQITDNSKMTFEENVVKMAEEATNSAANETQQINAERLLGLLRHKFNKELEEIQKRMIKKVLDTKSYLEALKAKDEWQLTNKQKYDLFLLKEHEGRNSGFFKLLRSPFVNF